MQYLRQTALLLLLPFFSICSTAQDAEEFAGRFSKKDVQISLSYGLPSPLRAYLNLRPPNNSRDISATGYGPNFLKVEYGLGNKISILATAYYNFNDVHWMQDARNPATGLQEPYRHGVETWEIAFGLRANYYYLKKKNWNLYAGLGAGMGYIELETYSMAPKERVYISYEEPSTWNFECTAGARYYLAKNIALFSELGIGQSWYLFEYYYIPSSFLQLGFSIQL